MARKRREFTVFSLSFLDIMSCGFGAVILIFIVIHHGTQTRGQKLSANLMSEVQKLKTEVSQGDQHITDIKGNIKQTRDQIASAKNDSATINEEINKLESQVDALAQSGTSKQERIEKLKQDLKKLQKQDATLKGSVAGTQASGSSLRQFVGDGDREYLTGMRMGGTHILILLDSSASMLHKTIVNAVRMSYMDDADKLKSAKWKRAVRTVEWIVANMPKDSKFQLYTFNSKAEPVVPGSGGKWLTSIDKKQTDEALAMLHKVIPGGGTSLDSPFEITRKFDPMPDNVFLITDGLPTLGKTPPKRATVTPEQRAKLFSSAVSELPQDIPVNIVLFPMEGDPQAAPYFWILAQMSHGSFLAPSKDWP
ncbi:MAG TPA: VWA domain-containing protein [Pseudomonadales bacterium]|nr:VWA domain-containing protein [Pseudomonadales bacterium]